jgi:hypothetical protein
MSRTITTNVGGGRIRVTLKVFVDQASLAGPLHSFFALNRLFKALIAKRTNGRNHYKQNRERNKSFNEVNHFMMVSHI